MQESVFRSLLTAIFHGLLSNVGNQRVRGKKRDSIGKDSKLKQSKPLYPEILKQILGFLILGMTWQWNVNPHSYARISLSSSATEGNYLSNMQPRPQWHKYPSVCLREPGGPAELLSHFSKYCGIKGSREFSLTSFSTFLFFPPIPRLPLAHEIWALKERLIPNKLKQSSEWEYSLGKKCSRNTPTHSGLQKCFYQHNGQSTIKDIKL